VGFPVALFFAWMRELTPAEDEAKPATTRLDYGLAGALVVVIGLVSYQQLSSPSAPQGDSNRVDTADVRPGGPPASGSISVAVLPFAGAPEQEFFSDGMTDEIIAALAKVRSLRIVGRSSVFQFKGQNRDLREIGRQLGATHIVDGSVRQAGNRVRVTVQLIKADDGIGMWAENYDRELTDIFAIQEDIAKTVTASLSVPLGLPQGELLVSSRTNDLGSYQDYLRARALYRARTIPPAIDILERLVAREPDFAPAWALLAQVYFFVPQNSPIASDAEGRANYRTAEQKMETAAKNAIRLDPQNASAYAALADIDFGRQRWIAGEDNFRKALSLDPNDPDILHRYTTRLGITGRVKESLVLRQNLETLDPFLPYNVVTARLLVTAGDTQRALSILQQVPPGTILQGGQSQVTLARAYAAQGRFGEAADALATAPALDTLRRDALEEAARVLRAAPRNVSSADLPRFSWCAFNFVYAYVGALERVLEAPETITECGPAYDILWQAEAAPLRKTERFKKFARDVGLADYWRARGWADACRPVGANDFACE
jgi:TolB-like protein/tetratricopeptide (TPR) repeat protein